MGDLTGDLSGKRGHVTGTDSPRRRPRRSRALAPLSELADYQTRLKSVTGGQGSYSIEFSHYAPVPPGIQKSLAEQHAKTAHAEEQ